MKGWMMGVLLLGASVSVEAEDNTPHKLCSGMSELAEVIAKGRYAGVPMRDMAEVMDGDAMSLALVRDAYNLPDWSGDERQQRAMTKFGNNVYSVCIEQLEAAKAEAEGS